MHEVYPKYLAALRSFVQGSAPEALTEEQWRKLLELAYIHSTQGILCHVYLAHPELVNPAQRPTLRQMCFNEVGLYATRAEKMAQLAAQLNQNAIDCLLFKGFVVRQYYPVPELRTFGDIDLVIRKEDREKCHSLMLSLGYTAKIDWEPVYSYVKDGEYYEIHTQILEVDVSDKADYMTYFADAWQHAQPSDHVKLPHIYEFTPEFHFLYLLTHIAKHISGSGAGIRMYLDVAFFIRHFGDTLDWQWIEGELEKLRFEAFANMVLTAVEQWFGVKSPLALKPVAPEVTEDFLEFTMEGGVYGYAGRDKSLIFLKQQNRNEEDVSKLKTLMYHAFPPVKALKNRYPYLQKNPVLLPVAWVQRLADSRKEWGRFADHTKNIVTADTEEVLKLKRMYKEIGL